MRFDVITLFPDFFISPLNSGLIGRALAKQIARVNLINPRDFTTDKHHRVDDEPYGGGVGMLLKPEPIFAAVRLCNSIIPNILDRQNFAVGRYQKYCVREIIKRSLRGADKNKSRELAIVVPIYGHSGKRKIVNSYQPKK